MTTPVIPQDIAAEEAVLGDMLQFPDTVAQASQKLASTDFYAEVHRLVFDLIVSAWKQGRRLDATSLADALRQAGHEPDPHWLGRVAATLSADWRTHAETIIRLRAKRDVHDVLAQAALDLRAPGTDPFDLVDQIRARLAAIEAPTTEAPSDLWSLDEFIDQPEHESSPWVVDGLLRRGWRCVIVAPEGLGKSVLFRQFAVAAAQGIHPLEFRQIPKVRTLLIDLENPADAIAKSCRSLRSVVSREVYEPGRAWLWHRPAGIDLRSRATRAELEAVLAACRPDLVTLGPLYKAHRRRGQETDEEITADIQEILDDFRTRYGFALLLEHHAPQMDGYGHRKLRPYGSSLWLRWPELGLAMVPPPPEETTDRREVQLERWRMDRMTNTWPKRLEQGASWPWVAS